MNIVRTIINKSKARPMIKLKTFRGVTIHETGNYKVNANAKAHANYINGSGSLIESSYHYAVDDEFAYNVIPEDEVAYHAASTDGNYNTVAIEICVEPNTDFNIATDNAAYLAADILYRKGHTKVIDGEVIFSKGNLFQHHSFKSSKYPNGKNCPMQIRSNKSVINWKQFVDKVSNYLSVMVKAETVCKIVDNMHKKEYIIDRDYWLNVLNYKTEPNIEYVNILLRRALGLDDKNTPNLIAEYLYKLGKINSLSYWKCALNGSETLNIEWFIILLGRL